MNDRDIWFADLEAFLHELRDVNEFDYGDFMRKVNFYLDTLAERLVPLDIPEKESYAVKLAEIQNYVQFYPDWKIETTRPRLFADVKAMWDQAKLTAGVADRDVEPFPTETLSSP